MKRIIQAGIFLLAGLTAGPGAFAQTWTHIGPNRDNNASNQFQTGRLDCIGPDYGFNGTTNQTLYVGSSSGSLWKSTDAGATWNAFAIPDYVKYHGITALCPSPGGYMLASTINCGHFGDHIGDVYQFYTATNSWSSTNFGSVSGNAKVFHFRFDPANSQIVFAASSGGLYKSTDGGATWALSVSGAFENVCMLPATWATDGYEVYASGTNTVVYSSDMGTTFNTKTSITTLLGSTYYADIATTYDVTGGIVQYLYVDALVSGNHHIVRLNLDKNVQSNQSVSDYGNWGESAPSEDRMTVAAYDQSVYFGHGGLMKYNAVTGVCYTIGTGTDYHDSFYNYPTGTQYNSPAHSDSHDLMFFPSLNKMIYVSDGGCFINSYSIGASNVFTNSWASANNGLNISQIWGLSVSDEDPDYYMTGEQDAQNGAYVSQMSTYTVYASGTEPSMVLIDKFNHNNFMHSGVTTSDIDLRVYYNSGFAYSGLPQYPVTSICNSVNDTGMGTGLLFHPGPEFSSNTLFQDPNYPDKIYMGTKNSGLFEFCTSNKKFTLKHSFPASAGASSPWQQYITGIAFTKLNKNKVYVLQSNRNQVYPDANAPAVYVYSGTDFNASYAGSNDSWTDISPNFNAAPFSPGVSYPASEVIEVTDIAASDWYPDRLYLTLRNVPGNPGIKVLRYNAGTWTDYSTGIPTDEIPVSMVYDQGSNDMLYLGTNANVYYRDASMLSWQSYSGTLPNLGINQIRIDYGDNTLRAGTYGQGMWRSPLKCPALYSTTESGAYMVDKFVEAEHDITATLINTNINKIFYRAGAFIDITPVSDMNPSTSTAVFEAFIHNCNTSGNTFRVSPPDPEEADVFGEDELDKEPEDLFLFPNPGHNEFYLSRQPDPGTPVMVFDITGRTIETHLEYTDRTCMLDLSNAPAGIYILKAIVEGEEKNIRIVKQ